MNEWTLCKVENSVTLFSLYDNIYNGEVEFGEIEFEIEFLT